MITCLFMVLSEYWFSAGQLIGGRLHDSIGGIKSYKFDVVVVKLK